MIERKDIVSIGQFNRTHGLQGEISATLDCDTELLTRFRCIVVDIDGIYVPFFVGGLRPKNQQTALLKIDDIDTDVEASKLVNREIFVLKDEYRSLQQELTDDDEMPLSTDFLVGFAADVNGEYRGEITGVDDQTANVLFEVTLKDDDRQLLIPAVDEMISDIDFDEQRVVFDVPEDLLELMLDN